MLSRQLLATLAVFAAMLMQPSSNPLLTSWQLFFLMSEQSQQAPQNDLSFQAFAATLTVLVSINTATLIPCHHRGRLLGPELNSMYRLPRQYVSEYWVKPRDALWFEANLMAQYEEADFRKKLRTDRATFVDMCSVLAPMLKKQDTRLRKAKTVEKRVAMGLWHYAHGGTYENTGEKFGCSAALAHGVVREFIAAVLVKYAHKVTFPTGDALHQVMKGFESKRNMPNCFGAIDCTHFLVSTPCIADYKGYYDRHGTPSTILQALVDSQGRFIDTYAGSAGCMNDSRVFAFSPICQHLFAGRLVEPVVEINGINMQPYFVGDAGYKLEKFCVIPYLRSELHDPVKERFNFYQSSTRIVVEQAFGRLKGRFRWLNGRITVHNPMEHADIINVGCILHNIMMDSDVKFDKQWAKGVRLRCGARIRPEKDHTLGSIELRDALAQYVVDKNTSY